MIAVFETYDLAFVGVPQCMATRVLRTFYRLEHGAGFDLAAMGGTVHRYYAQMARRYVRAQEPPDLEGLSGFWSFTVLRNPLQRLLSVHGERVLVHRDIERAFERLGDGDVPEGLPALPDADTFFRNLPRYRALVPSIRYHSDPFAQFLGPDLSRYDAIFHAEDVTRLSLGLSEKVGQPVTLEQAQHVGQPVQFAALSVQAQDQIIAQTEADFALLAEHYSLEHSLHAVQAA